MKIVQPGMLQPQDRTWWYNRVATCPECRCGVRLEHGDEMAVYVGNGVATVPCPTDGCGGTCSVSKPGSAELRFHTAAGVERR